MAVSKSKTTRKLQLVTKGPKLSAKGRKTADWLDKQYEGPVTLTRQQFVEVYDFLVASALDIQDTIDSHIPVGDPNELEQEVLARAEFDFARLNRLLYRFERHLSAEKVRGRLDYQVPLRQEFMDRRRRAGEIGGAA